MRAITRVLPKGFLANPRFYNSEESEGASFLKMVENYIDKAGRHTNIRADKLNFYKKPENVVKFTLTLVRGNQPLI